MARVICCVFRTLSMRRRMSFRVATSGGFARGAARRGLEDAGEGVERTFTLHSSRVSDVKVKDRGVIRRAKLYFLREREGKATRLTRNLGKLKWPRSGAGSGLTAADSSAETPAAEE